MVDATGIKFLALLLCSEVFFSLGDGGTNAKYLHLQTGCKDTKLIPNLIFVIEAYDIKSLTQHPIRSEILQHIHWTVLSLCQCNLSSVLKSSIPFVYFQLSLMSENKNIEWATATNNEISWNSLFYHMKKTGSRWENKFQLHRCREGKAL